MAALALVIPRHAVNPLTRSFAFDVVGVVRLKSSVALCPNFGALDVLGLTLDFASSARGRQSVTITLVSVKFLFGVGVNQLTL